MMAGSGDDCGCQIIVRGHASMQDIKDALY